MKLCNLFYGFVALIFALMIFSSSVSGNAVAGPNALAEASASGAAEELIVAKTAYTTC